MDPNTFLSQCREVSKLGGSDEKNLAELGADPTYQAHILGVGPDSPTCVNMAGGAQSKIPFRCDLFDGPAMLRLAGILAQGAQKYGPENWRKIPRGDHLNHALSHVFAHLAGDSQDDHLGHAFCRLMFAVATQ